MFEGNRESLAKEWEGKLAEAGMPAELGPDKGAQALQRAAWAERGVDADSVMDAMRMYWIYAATSSHGEHRKAMQDIANRLGLTENDIDESLMKSVEEEIAAADRAALRISRQYPSKVKQFTALQAEFPEFSDEVLDGVLMKRAA